ELMEQRGAVRDRLSAAIGPAIGQASYEVDEDLRQRFVDDEECNARFFVEGPGGKPHFDLPGYVAHRLLLAGVGTIERLALDTYAQPDRFFSYRRATHRQEPDYGRQISLIGIRG
ncbi:MAG TPA: laccase domain-containing protein, partial [Sphingomicrobium sp.]